MSWLINLNLPKIVINLETQTDAFVQIDCKTEMKSSPKLLFKHKVKRKK